VIFSAIIWRKKATGQKWAKKYTVHYDLIIALGRGTSKTVCFQKQD
jgi:hypothetical protein